jgi:hypothetical protein
VKGETVTALHEAGLHAGTTTTTGTVEPSANPTSALTRWSNRRA